MKKWIVGFSLSFGCVFGAPNNSGSPCLDPCQPANYNGLAFAFMPSEFYFAPCDRPCGADVNLTVIGNFGKTISSTKDYITTVLNTRQFFNCYETYADVKWHYFSNWRNALNAGIGVRSFDMYRVVGGANLYYDYMRGPCNLNFHQISGGFELFHPCFSLYGNVYWPFQTCQNCESNVFNFDGGAFAVSHERICSFGGLDLEVDKSLFYWSNTRINFGLGAYFYDNIAVNQWFAGFRYRLVADLTTNIRAEMEGTYDKYFKSRVIGRISINIPFPVWGCARKTSGCCQSWCPPLPQHRNNLIVLFKETCWNWNFDDRKGRFRSHHCGSGDQDTLFDDNE